MRSRATARANSDQSVTRPHLEPKPPSLQENSSVPTAIDPRLSFSQPVNFTSTLNEELGQGVSPGTSTTSPSGDTPEVESNYLARTALSKFYLDGIKFSNWQVFQVADDFRIVYVGAPVSNMSHLVELGRSQRSSRGAVLDQQPQQSEDESSQMQYDNVEQNGQQQRQQILVTQSIGDDQRHDSTLHYPYPQIRPINSWLPGPQAFLRAAPDLATDLSSFPSKEVCASLLKAYFDNIHPTFPVVTPATFLQQDGTPTGLPPLLLYQAVLLAGAHVCSHPRVVKERWLVKATLFRRAAMLFHLRHEKDRLHLTQAALLLTWHINDGDNVAGGPWYWTGVALRISCGQGGHRHNAQLPAFERIMYKRSWWCAYVSEAFSALETGRPCAVRPEDIDQSLPTEKELDWDRRQTSKPMSSSDSDGDTILAHPGQYEKVPFKYHKHVIELASIVMDILALNTPSGLKDQDPSAVDSRLALWLMDTELASSATDEDFYVSHLRLYYNMVVLQLHRNYRKKLHDSQLACSTAADSVVIALERIVALDALGRCHFPVVSAVTAAGIQLVQDIRSAITTNAYLVCLNRLERLGRLINCSKSLGQYWPHAEAVYNVFEGLRKDYECQVTKGLHPWEESCDPGTEPDWNNIFASMQVPDIGQMPGEDDWLNFTNWTA